MVNQFLYIPSLKDVEKIRRKKYSTKQLQNKTLVREKRCHFVTNCYICNTQNYNDILQLCKQI